MNKNKKNQLVLKSLSLGCTIASLTWMSQAFAEDLGTMASQLTSTFANVGLAITGLSYVGGLGFAIASILQFKQHKENPSQTPIGKPISQILIAAALLFLPSAFSAVGNTIFASGGTTAGPSGTTIDSSSS